jgi:hypothetical protein
MGINGKQTIDIDGSIVYILSTVISSIINYERIERVVKVITFARVRRARAYH